MQVCTENDNITGMFRAKLRNDCANEEYLIRFEFEMSFGWVCNIEIHSARNHPLHYTPERKPNGSNWVVKAGNYAMIVSRDQQDTDANTRLLSDIEFSS